MKCPVDQVELSMSDRQGIEIDYCPQCRGVWLDRGELDKIIDRANASQEAPLSRQESRPPSHHDSQDYDRHYDDGYHDKHSKGYKKRKKEGKFGDLFDF